MDTNWYPEKQINDLSHSNRNTELHPMQWPSSDKWDSTQWGFSLGFFKKFVCRHCLFLEKCAAATRTRDLGLICCTRFFSPTERRRHITAGVEKQANTSSVQEKWVTCGRTTDCPRHWPHMYTWPLCVLAEEVWAEWHAAISTILDGKNHKSANCRHQTSIMQILIQYKARFQWSSTFFMPWPK